MNKIKLVNAALALSLMAPISSASAALVLIGTGNTVDFFYNDTDAGTAEYGLLQVVGDTVYATPSFEVSSANGEGTVIDSNIGSIYVVAHDGFSFTGVDLIESGTYSTSGNGSVNIEGNLQVLDSNNPFTFDNTNPLSFSDLSASGINSWQGSLSYDMTTAMWSNTSAIQLTLTNILYATSPDAGSTAYINQTLTGSNIGMQINTIPVPAAVWLFGSGLIGLAGVARRKKS